MESNALLHALLSTQTPLLPLPGVARVYLSLGWGLALAGVAIWLLQRRGTVDARLSLGLPLALLLWCLLPGTVSPAYWLGLAFRAPSLLLALLCAAALVRHYRPQVAWPGALDALRPWALVPVLLGWALLLDTFAVWPLSLYALGFAPLTLGVLVLLGLLPWLLRGTWALSALVTAALVLFVFFRLPSGNVWDALLDPWLWVLLQADWLRQRRGRRAA